MNRNAYIFCFVVLSLAGLGGCSSAPPANESKKAAAVLDKIQGTAIVLSEATATANDSAMSAGGQPVFLSEGVRRYRLFLNAPVKVVPGEEYIAEGVYAQKAIDAIGDPDQGKNGYPLQSSCDRVIRMVWTGLPFDVADGHASVLRTSVKRYPARPIFLVMRLTPVPAKEGADAKKAAPEKELPEVTVAPEKQRALLVEGPVVQTAPLWEPAGGTVHCKVVIGKDGKIEELETGTQLCEAVPWAQFRYQPPVQGGHPVKVKTEVEIRFDARK